MRLLAELEFAGVQGRRRRDGPAARLRAGWEPLVGSGCALRAPHPRAQAVDPVTPLFAIQADPGLARQRRASLGSAGELPGGPSQSIAAYLAAEQELGRVAPDVEPADVAVILLATLFGRGMTSNPDGAGVDPDRIRSAVRVLVRAIGRPAG